MTFKAPYKDDLIVRCDKDKTEVLLQQPGLRIFDLSGGRAMKGWLLVGPTATRRQEDLKRWIEHALDWYRRRR